MSDYKDLIRELGRQVKDGKLSWKASAKVFSERTGMVISSEAFRSRYRNLHDEYENTPFEDKLNQESETHNADGTIELTKTIPFDSNRKKTPKDILDLFGYDIDEWELVSWTFGKWETAVKGEGLQEQTTIRAKIRPRINELTNNETIAIINEVIKENINPIKLDIKKINEELDDDKLLSLSVADLHLGRYCNEIDSGYNYNMNIASEYFEYIIKELIRLQKQKKTGSLLYAIGNDYFNYDNTHGTTTKGTILSNSTPSYRELYKRGLELQIKALKSIREYFNQINVILVQGNHDEMLDYTLYLALEQIFKDDDVIKFKEDYKKTQADKFGNVAIFQHHGNTNNKRLIEKLPALFSEIYGSTKYRYAITNHVHNEQHKPSTNGIMQYIQPTLAPTDEYEYDGMFGSVEGSQQVFEFNKNTGLESISYIRVRR